MCGLVGEPATAWSPRDLRLLLRMHRLYGGRYKEPGFHSGYNEAIISSEWFNSRLPGIVEAFWVPNGTHANHDATGVDVVRAHSDFLARFQLSDEQVPLLKLTPSDWHAPLSHLDRVLVHAARLAPRAGSKRWGHSRGWR